MFSTLGHHPQPAVRGHYHPRGCGPSVEGARSLWQSVTTFFSFFLLTSSAYKLESPTWQRYPLII